ncbi:hypothetical protein HIM_09600 [Hirsutella minnesotensis 3608]|uniref:DUF659 domain-containing protein n=1 Tax=Hirsutella minnesotensis 3608 TaxID=1043627 RepID=A0A0F8A305_9HYPO|nr:hypothetical protein HIM_09600 [Hirsutella minnesotensis 3608]
MTSPTSSNLSDVLASETCGSEPFSRAESINETFLSETALSSSPIRRQMSRITPRKRGVTAQDLWSYATTAPEGEGRRDHKRQLIWYCGLCAEPPVWRSASRASARSHLHKVHGIDTAPLPKKVSTQAKHQIDSLITTQLRMQQDRAVEADEKQQKAMLRRALDKAAIQEALARLVTKRNLPDKCVEWPEFHAVFLACNPAITDEIPSAHSHLTTIIDRTFEDHRQVLARHLQQARSNIHLTVDGWTSPNRKALLAICAHFIDDTYRMCKVLLALPELRNGKGGDEQAAVVIPVLEQYSIAEKIGFITSDNHGSNDILCLAVQNHLKTSYQLKWNAKEKRLRCQGHVINIAVKAFLFGKDKSAVEEAFRQINHRTWQADEESDVLMSDILQGSRNWREIGPLGKLHNIAVHIRSSEARYKTFRDFGASKTLGLDNDTRWNSWYKLIERAVELEMHVDRYTKEFHDSLRNDHLSPEDWMQLRDTRDFLAPFHRATLSAEGSFATLDQTILTMDILLEHFKLSKVCCAFLSSVPISIS